MKTFTSISARFPQRTHEARYIALFDTNAGFLQWIGEATCFEAAIHEHLTDIGFNNEVEHSFDAFLVTPAQATALQTWADAGSCASDFPAGLDASMRYDGNKVMRHFSKPRHV